jgi:hypothetical protein
VILPHNQLDDTAFIRLLGSFVAAYVKSTSATRIYLTHIDNWFGESWLGFAGKWQGIAGVRQRRGRLSTDTRSRSLAIPPFRPTRVQSYAGYEVTAEGTLLEFAVSPLHCEKNGGCIQTLFGEGLFVWYSGNTSENSTGSLLVYELNFGGQDAWYLNFSTDDHAKWNVISCRNTQLKECRAIADRHYQQMN